MAIGALSVLCFLAALIATAEALRKKPHKTSGAHELMSREENAEPVQDMHNWEWPAEWSQAKDVSISASDPEYDCNGDGERNCGRWDFFRARCQNEANCEYRYKFGDIILDQSCRCRPQTPSPPTQAPVPAPTPQEPAPVPSPQPSPEPAPEPAPAPQPGHPDYDCNGDGNNDCGKWDILGFKCRDHDGLCEYRYKFGDLLFSHSCRCRLEPAEPTPAPTPAPPVAPVPAPPSPGQCDVPAPGWLLNSVDALVNRTLRAVLAATDPLPLEMRKTDLEFNLGFCTMKVDAFTLNNITGLSSQLKIGGWECLESECLQDGPNGCNNHRIKLAASMNFDILNAVGTDRSRWHCGSDLPLRKIDFSYVLLDTRWRMVFVFNLTYSGVMRTPSAQIIEVESMTTELGSMHQHQCQDDGELPPAIVEPLMRLFCQPILGLIGTFFRNLYFPIVDHSIKVLMNAVVTPSGDDRDPWSTAPLTDGLIITALSAAGLAVVLGCCCCCFFVSPRWSPRTEQQAPLAVPALLGIAIEPHTFEPASHATVPRGRQVRGSRA